MFEASGDDVRGAVQAVKDGKARLIETDGKKDVDEAIGEFVRSGVVIESVRKFVWGISAELVAYKHEESQIGL